jgi:hypothetical protein
MSAMLRIIFADFIRLLQPPTPLQLAEDELAQAQRELLKAHSAEEYARNIAVYNAQRIERLTGFINLQKEPPCQSNPSNSGTNVHAPIPLNRTSTSNSDATSKKSWR